MTSRWQEIAATIERSIINGTLKPGDRLPTEAELSLHWSVAPMTANRALTELQRRGIVHRRRRVGTIVADRGGVARFTVALLFYHADDFPQVSYMRGIRAALPSTCRLMLFDTKNDPEWERECLEQIRSEADAVICYPTCHPDNNLALQTLTDSGVPVVCVDRVPSDISIDGFVTDNYGSARGALQMLTDSGHARIAYLTYDRTHPSSVRDRYRAYTDTMAALEVHDSAALIRRFPAGMGYRPDMLLEAVYDAVFTLLHQPDPPTVLFCEQDYIMAGVIDACERQNVAVPGDVEIVSFSDCPPLLYRITRTVHRIVQPAQKIGELAARRAMARLTDRSLTPQVESLPADFVRATDSPIARPASTGAVANQVSVF